VVKLGWISHSGNAWQPTKPECTDPKTTGGEADFGVSPPRLPVSTEEYLNRERCPTDRPYRVDDLASPRTHRT
jgi:hypothetical protein